MKFLLCISFVISAVYGILPGSSGPQDGPTKASGDQSHMSFNRAYRKFSSELQQDHVLMSGNGDAKQRAKYYREAKKQIEAVNSDSSRSYSAEVNKFSIMSESEKNGFRGLNVSAALNRNKKAKREVVKRDTADSYSWYSYTTDIKDQGQCGSCWAFAGVAVVETLNKAYGGSIRQMSDQEIVDCNSSGSECEGGWYTTVWDYVKSSNRLAYKSSYDYAGVKGSCRSGSTTNALQYSLNSYDGSGGTTEADLVSDLYTYGPVAIAVRCSTNFYSYSSGVFNEDVAYSVDHAVVAIGYASNYFLVRNSWGTSWGVSGHIYLGRGLSSYNTYAYYSAHITSMSAMKRVEEKEE